MASNYDRRYAKARAKTLEGDPACWRCGRAATTADHVPALALHEHLRGSGCCELWPACAKCNYSGGGRIGGRRVQRKRRVRYEASRVW